MKTIEQRAQEYCEKNIPSLSDMHLAIATAYEAGADEEHRLLTEWYDARERPEKDGWYLLKCTHLTTPFACGKYCYESDTWDCGTYFWLRETGNLLFTHWRPINE